ncbi:acetyl-CoA hydrolase/transferase C-terminal domain-containing protein [Woeseia oceani]|uniref:Acetyl-CoA hydrolase/transferase C-terminal domain-containing protein n=1 Tax=Woeseia oceani TaxID=1548547 RepID=A0A193LJP2_9GAMM|nr:acetyl-CoA hydrolase/transferase C-terminal domain-containing protein [Woeseia oceani]ANO52676.1 hypothetical protein BA177_17095 [Woeseia oceani]
MTRKHASATSLVDELIADVGKELVVGVPIGIGKAVHIVDAFFARAEADPSISLTVFTGLTLVAPPAPAGLAGRFAAPLLERLYGDCPVPSYVQRVASNSLPPNVQIREFYLRPGAYLSNAQAQQNYTSINYSQVVGELLALGVNVIAQLVAVDGEARDRYSLSSNPEVTLDLLPAFQARRRAGEKVAMVGQVNRRLPYMYGASEVPAATLDYVLEDEQYEFPLFGLLNRQVKPADYATGMHVASLVADGGTLQLGIGSLSDAVAHCLRLRHESPDIFRALLEQLPGGLRSPARNELPVYTGPFDQGLYASTEMLSDAVFSLMQSGLIRRPADKHDKTLIHAGFFVGSNALYEGLQSMPPEQRRLIDMTRISFVNTLFGDQDRKRKQRRDARFINETMMATLLGAAVSDALDDGRVVSGVGGQFDFVSMAHSLQDAYSILMLPAARTKNGRPSSNIRWSYGHTTVPRHHRDVYATQYGLAATRGKTDMQTITAMLQIADARFQNALVTQAKKAGKLAATYRLPDPAGQNRPEVIESLFSSEPFRSSFPRYPLGTDMTATEQKLAAALEWLEAGTATAFNKAGVLASALLAGDVAASPEALTRLGLDITKGMGERLQRRLISYAWQKTGQTP